MYSNEQISILYVWEMNFGMSRTVGMPSPPSHGIQLSSCENNNPLSIVPR